MGLVDAGLSQEQQAPVCCPRLLPDSVPQSVQEFLTLADGPALPNPRSELGPGDPRLAAVRPKLESPHGFL